jgi:hypothetical protein
VKEVDGELVVEEVELAERSREEVVELGADVDPGSTISFRPSARPAAPAAKRRIDPPIDLKTLLRAIRGGGQLPAPGPYLATTTSLDRASLSRCWVHALGTAASWVVVGPDGQVEEQSKLVIGRGTGSDLIVSDGRVSKKHAELAFDRGDGVWKLRDLSSSNGTEVAGEELTPGRWVSLTRSGTRIVFGTEASLTFLEAPALLAFLQAVLEAASEATAGARKARAEAAPPPELGSSLAVKLSDEAPSASDGPAEAEPANGESAVEFADQAPQTDEFEYVAVEGDDPVAFVPDPVEPAPEPGDPPTSPVAPTRKLRRPKLVKRPKDPKVAAGAAQFQLARPGQAKRDAARATLSKKLTPHLEAGATIRIVLKGGAEGTAESVDQAVEVLAAYGKSVLRIEADLGGKRTVVFAR